MVTKVQSKTSEIYQEATSKVSKSMLLLILIRPKKKKLFVSCNGPKKRVGRSVKKKICIIFLVKNVGFMHVFR